MTLSALGIFSAAGAGGVVAPAYELIETQILSSSTPSITFSSLGTYSSTYKHLQLRMTGRSDRGSFDRDVFYLRLNGDTGANYATHVLVGAGNNVYSAAGSSVTSMDIGSYLPATGSVSGQFGGYVVDLLDTYSTTKNKTMRSLSGGDVESFASGVTLSSGVWLNTASVTSITAFSGTSSNLITGSRFSLYGIKG